MPAKGLFKLVTRPFPPLQAFAFIVGHRDFVDYGYSYTVSLPEGKEGNSIWLLEEEHFDHAKRLGDKAELEPDYVNDLIRDCYIRSDSLLAATGRLSNVASDARPDELERALRGYFGAYLFLTRHLFTPHYVEMSFTTAIREWLYQQTKKSGRQDTDVDTLFEQISVPSKESEAFQLQLETLRLLTDASGSRLPGGVSDAQLESLVERFGWLPMINLANTAMTVHSLRADMQRQAGGGMNPSQKLASLRTGAEARRLASERVITELGPPEQILRKIRQLQEFVYLRTYRMEVYGRSHAGLNELLERIADRAGIPTLLVKYLTHEELLDYARAGRTLDCAELSRRQTAYAIIMRDAIIQPVIAGQDAMAARQSELLGQSTSGGATTARGTPSSAGVAVGIVRIVRSPEDVDRVKRGDILVAIMTTTDFTPVLPLVGAVVTDEGGITCHAAVVTRELGIPCIVGTVNGTKVLKEGTRVRVDATNGVVTALAE